MKQTGYKMQFGDILCISDWLLSEEKKKAESIKQAKGQHHSGWSQKKQDVHAERFKQMVVFENKDVVVIDKPCGTPS